MKYIFILTVIVSTHAYATNLLDYDIPSPPKWGVFNSTVPKDVLDTYNGEWVKIIQQHQNYIAWQGKVLKNTMNDLDVLNVQKKRVETDYYEASLEENKNLKDTIRQLETDFTIVQEECSNAKNSLILIEKENKDITQQLKLLKEKTDQDREVQEEALNNIVVKYQLLLAEKDELNRQVQSLQKEKNQALTQLNQNFEEERGNARKERDSFSLQITTLEENLLEKTEESENRSAQINELTISLEETNKNFLELTEKFEEEKETRKKVTLALQNEKEEKKNLQEENKYLINENNNFNEANRKLTSDLNQTKLNLHQTEARFLDQTNELQEVENKLALLHTSHHDISEENKNLKNLLSEKKNQELPTADDLSPVLVKEEEFIPVAFSPPAFLPLQKTFSSISAPIPGGKREVLSSIIYNIQDTASALPPPSEELNELNFQFRRDAKSPQVKVLEYQVRTQQKVIENLTLVNQTLVKNNAHLAAEIAEYEKRFAEVP